MYTPEGWVDFPEIMKTAPPFIIMMGGRGTGKTYGALKMLIEQNAKIIYMRRTQVQANMVLKEEVNPVKKVMKDLGIDWTLNKVNEVLSVITYGEEDGKILMCALSTMGNVRGFDADEYEHFIYDEFIPDKLSRKMKGEADGFSNAYETINRNREIEGRKPLQAYLLTNSNTILNDILITFGIVTAVARMKKQKREVLHIASKGIVVYYLRESPISEKKKQTALYRATAGTSFFDMAISNEFADMGIYNVRNVPLTELRPIVSLGELCFYEHKSENYIYVSDKISGSPPKCNIDLIDAFRSTYNFIVLMHCYGELTYQNEVCPVLLTKYLNGV
jgi:hypothetical protein